MKFTTEQLEKARETRSAEELRTLARESGREFTEEEANRYFDMCHMEGVLSDDELGNVTGGCGGNGGDSGSSEPTYKYYCPVHGKGMEEHYASFGFPFTFYACPDCQNGYMEANGTLTLMSGITRTAEGGWSIKIM